MKNDFHVERSSRVYASREEMAALRVLGSFQCSSFFIKEIIGVRLDHQIFPRMLDRLNHEPTVQSTIASLGVCKFTESKRF